MSDKSTTMNDMKHTKMDYDPTNSLKRCNSTPIINLPTANKQTASPNTCPMATNSVSSTTSNITITTSRSRDASPTPNFNLFGPRARRYSTGFSPLATNPGPLPRLTPRVSQLRQEECIDMSSREANHEREANIALQISQSWEDLTLDAENWSFKCDNSSDLTNPLHVTLPTGISCSSPSPTSSRAGLRLPPYGLSPSPTRRTFQTRRSMSPIAMRPSSLGPVKRKFELDENYSNSYSPPPFKKIFTESSSRGHSPCRSPLLQSCPSPDSTEGRTTPKFYISKLCTNSSSNHSSSMSATASPNSSSAMEIPIDIPNLCAKAIATVTSANSELNSDIECSDLDFENDDKMLPAAQKPDETCEKLKKLFFARVSTDSTETDCSSIDFKPQLLGNESHLNLIVQEPAIDNKSESSMDCDSLKRKTAENFGIVQNEITSTDDFEVANGPVVSITNVDETIEIINPKCVPIDSECVTISNGIDTVERVPIAVAAKSTYNNNSN